MKVLKFVLLLIGTSSYMIACGGSGGGNNNSANEAVIGLKTDTIRTQAQDDAWEYAVSGTLSDGSSTVDISGPATFQIISTTKKSPVTGNDFLDEYGVMNLSTPSGLLVVSLHKYLHQDGNGSIYIGGQELNSGDIWVTSPASGHFLTLESPVFVGQNNGSSVIFDDGSSLSYTYSITDIENVSTGIGTFEAYRVEVNVTFDYANGDREVESNTEWHVPGLGMVKLQSDSSYYSGGVFSLSMNLMLTLSDTSVSY